MKLITFTQLQNIYIKDFDPFKRKNKLFHDYLVLNIAHGEECILNNGYRLNKYEKLIASLAFNSYVSAYYLLANEIGTMILHYVNNSHTWNRYRACGELSIQPAYREFTGTDSDALDFVMRTNKRRNLNSSQWAAIAVEADEMVSGIREQVEREKAERNRIAAIKQHGGCINLLLNPTRDPNENSVPTKLAATFNTNRTYINEASRLRRDKPELFEQVKRGEVTIPETKKPHVSNNSGENQWYTPEHIIEAARTTMGRIDVDPASSHVANTTVKANTYYTESNNGLTKEWNGNVWMNPPYAQPLISQFVEKLIEKFLSGEVKKACVLVNNATDTTWFHSIVRISSAICFTKGRVRFIDMNGNPGAPLQGQAIIYIGKTDAYKFCQSFSEIGFVLKNQ